MTVVDRIKDWHRAFPSAKARLPVELKIALEELELPGFQTVPEKFYAITNELLTRPICIVCGGRVHFKGGFAKTCSVKCAAKNPDRQIKSSKTSLEKYGTSHPVQSEIVQAKIRETNQTRYGQPSSTQAASVKLKIADTNLKRYGNICSLNGAHPIHLKKQTWMETRGVDNPAKCKIVQEKKSNTITFLTNVKKQALFDLFQHEHQIVPQFADWVGTGIYQWKHLTCSTIFEYPFTSDFVPRCPACFPKSVSLEERAIQSLLTRLQVPFIANDRKVLAPKELDILIPSANLAIEINGAYWHHDGRIPFQLSKKTELIKPHNISLLHFWDFEIREKPLIVENIIKAKLKLHQKHYARTMSVISITAAEASGFLNERHLAGFAKAKSHFALIKNNVIYAVASFSPNRFAKDNSWELVRFASRDAVIGGLGKLIAAFRKKITAPLFSYADARISNGAAYETLGFTYLGLTRPNYFYIKGNKRLFRQQAMKCKLADILDKFNPALTEYDNMIAHGWFRCSDCGSHRFILA